MGLIAGAVYAAGWLPASSEAPVAVDCPAPPCFGGGGLPGPSALPTIVPLLAYLLAIVLGVPSLLAGAWDLLRGRWPAGGRRLLAFVGPVLFLVGTEVNPHLLNPCLLALRLGAARLPAFYCAYSPEWGADMTDRWHVLEHTLLGAVPLAALYGWALRRWAPR